MEVTGMLYGAKLLEFAGFPSAEVLGPGASEEEIKALIERHGSVFVKPVFKGGVGKKGKDEGIMLLVAIRDRRDRIEVGYGLEPILPDGFVGSVLREARPLLRQNAYGAAMFAAAEQMGSRIAAAKGVALDVSLRPQRRIVGERPSIPWPVIVVGIIILLVLMRGGGGGGFLTGMILGNLLGRGGGRGGWGGGGFGGYDSGGGGGGGFGGFGGGDSGGGGASSDW